MNADMSDSVIYRTKNYVDNWDEMKSYRLFALETCLLYTSSLMKDGDVV